MIQDIGDLLLRHIGSPGHIGSSAKLNGCIGQDPLKTVVGENRHMAFSTNAKFDQGSRQTKGSVPPLPIRNDTERTIMPAGCKGGVITPPIPRLHKNGGKVRFGNPTDHVRTEADR